jgi:acyl-coenzyme A thioesterase PaaI-like protein
MIEITQLPFNQLVGIEKCTDKEGGIFQLPQDGKYSNHLDTVHASALFSLAEASSGQFLIDHIKLPDTEKIVPLLRRADIKYRKPATGRILSRGDYIEEDWKVFHDTFDRRKRALIAFRIDLLDLDDRVLAQAKFEWFIAANN